MNATAGALYLLAGVAIGGGIVFAWAGFAPPAAVSFVIAGALFGTVAAFEAIERG